MKTQSNEKMDLIADEGKTYLISFNEQIQKLDDITMYNYDSVRIDKPLDYSKIVSSIINDKYDNNAMQAIINNHLIGDTEEHELEFQIMQEWRQIAKQVAKQVLGIE